MKQFWTEQEQQFLINNYPTKGGQFCAEQLNRTINSIVKKARRLNLSVINPISAKKLSNSDYQQLLFEKEIDFINLEDYIDSKTPILHECIAGHIWKVIPNSILYGQGCPECAGNKKKDTKSYQAQTLYQVLEPYINSVTPISHKCDKDHIWKASPNNILRGRGCPSCSKSGFDPLLPAKLYYIKIGDYYKLGITNRSIRERFYGDNKPIEILLERNFLIGKDAYIKEQELLAQYKDYRITVPGYLRSKGNTELFGVDLLTKGLLF